MFPRHGWLLSIGLACSLVPAAPADPTPEEKAPRRDAHGDPLPPGALARLGTTRFRVGDAGSCLAVAPDGATLATGGGSSVRFWDRATGEERLCVGLPVLYVLAAAFSPDGKYFTAFGDHQSGISRPIGGRSDLSVFLGTVADGKILHQFRGEYTPAVFSADSKWLLVHERSDRGDPEHPVLVWDIAGGKEARRFPAVLSYALSPDCKVLAGGGRDGVIHLWDAKSGTERGQLKGHSEPVQVLAFSPDGRTLASGSGESHRVSAPIESDKPKKPDNSVRLWDLTTGKERLPPRRHADPIWRLRFAPDGQSLASADERSALYLWDVATGRLRQHFPRDLARGNGFLFSPDGRHLFYRETPITSAEDRMIYQWDIAAGKEVRRWRMPERWLQQFFLPPDGKTLLVLGDSIRAWDIASGEERHAEPGHRVVIRSLTFSGDGKLLATVDGDDCLRAWDVARGVQLPSLAARRVVRCAFTPDDRLLLTIAADTTVSVREIPSGRVVRRFRIGTEKTVGLWERIANLPWGRLNLHDHPHEGCVFDRGCRLLATVGEDQNIHLWDVRRGEELHRLEGHRGLVYDLLFSPDGKWLFSRGEDRSIRWWDVGRGAEIQRFQANGVEQERACFSLPEDGRLLAWAGGEQIHLYDLPARKEVRRWKGHADGTNRLLLGREGAVLASTGEDGAIRYWDIRTGGELRAIAVKKDQRVIDLLPSPGGRILAHVSMDGKNSQYALRDVSTGCEICRMESRPSKEFALAPDGHTVVVNRAKWVYPRKAVTDKKSPYPSFSPIRVTDELTFVEQASGGVIASVTAGHRGDIRCLTFSPDGKVLATGGVDTTVLLWDWRRLTGLAQNGAAKSADKDIEPLWADLASPAASKAYRAIGALAASGDRAMALLRERLRPATAAERERWRKLVADLDHNDFAVREKAAQALMRLGVEAEVFLRRAAAEKVPLEVRRRLEQILASDEMKRPSADSLRKIRATQVLEAIDTPAARELLAAWSGGDADAWLTREARSALRRLQRGAANSRVP